MASLTAILDLMNEIFWGYILIYGLLAVGVFFTIRLRLLQIVNFREMFRVVLARDTTRDKEDLSPVQALCTSLASRVRLLLVIAVGREAIHQKIEIDQMAVKFRSIDAGEKGLSAHTNSAAATHSRAVDHHRIE